MSSQDAEEGIRSFVERRAAVFNGQIGPIRDTFQGVFLVTIGSEISGSA